MLLSSCNRGTLLHSYQPIPSDGWSRTDTLRFALPDVPHDGHYVFSIALRYTNAFPYEAITVVAETQLEQPHRMQQDTLYLSMYDPEGRPAGSGIRLMQTEVPLTSLSLHEGQQGTVSLRHIMAREVLPNITDVGLRIRRQP